MKLSDSFEGPNSSLRKAFDGATKDTPQSDPVSDFFNAPEEVKRPVYERALVKAQEEQSNTDWREEFDGKFGNYWSKNLGGNVVFGGDLMQPPNTWVTVDRESVKDFISQLLEAEKKRWGEERDTEWKDAISYLIANSEGSQDWYSGLRACRSIEIKRKNKGEDMTKEELEAEGDWNEEPEIPFEIEMQ